MAKPPPGLDMFGEMDWKKKAKAEKNKWEAASKSDDSPSIPRGETHQQSQRQQKTVGGSKVDADASEFGQVVGGKWVMAKPPPGLDMFAEMDWKKKAKLAKAKWEDTRKSSAALGGESPTDVSVGQPSQEPQLKPISQPEPDSDQQSKPMPQTTSKPELEQESASGNPGTSVSADASLNEAEAMMAAMASEKQAKLDKAAERRAMRAKKKEDAAATAGKGSTAGGGGSNAPTMPEGLSALQRVKWKKEHPDYVESKNTAKGNPKGKPAVASKDLDKDMPEEIRNASKLEQLKWRKKYAQEQQKET